MKNLVFSKLGNSIGESGVYYTDDVNQMGDYLGSSSELCREYGFCFVSYGYYTDNDARETFVPGVAKLHTSKGFAYLPVVSHSDWYGSFHYPRDAVFSREEIAEDAIREALNSAHNYAETLAESAREDDAKFQAEQQIEYLRNEILGARTSIKSLIAAIRAQRQTSTIESVICNTLTEKIQTLRKAISKYRKTITKFQNDYWCAVEA
jgi:hypothetical protein